MLLAFILLYLMMNLFIGYWASGKVKGARDFVIAGRRLPVLVAGPALFATWFGSETIMGSSSEFVEAGVPGIISDPLGAALCLMLVGLFFARPIYRLNILTFNDFFRMRFNSSVELISVLAIVPSYFGWIAAQLLALALILQAILGLPILAGILLCAAVVVAYTYTGGMWAVSATDFVQTIMIIIGLIFLAVSLVGHAGGLSHLAAQQPGDFFRFFPRAGFTDWMVWIAAWMTFGLGGIPSQDIFQRTMSARSERAAAHSAFLAGLLYLSIGLFPLFIALAARQSYPGLAEGEPQMLLLEVAMAHTGLPLQILFFGALISAILSTTSGAILAPATVIGENLIKPRFPGLSDGQLLRAMRYSVIGVTAIATVMANMNSSIHDLVASSTTLLLTSLFIPLAMGLYWKKASCAGALAAIFGGAGAWLACELAATEIPATIFGLLGSMAGMVGGSLLAPDESYAAYQAEATG